MSINQELEKLYAEKWDNLYAQFQNIKNEQPCNPLMLSIEDEDDYKTADLRVMFFGRETSGGKWRLSDTSKQHPVKEIMDDYQRFFDNKTGSVSNKGMGAGMNLFKTLLEEKYPGKRIRYVWNNIVKSGNPSGTYPSDEIRNVVFEHFNVIRQEINILKPDIILLATGVKGYGDIERQFGKLDYQPIPLFHPNQLCRTALPEFPFVKYAFRMYHLAGHYNKYHYLGAIIKLLN